MKFQNLQYISSISKEEIKGERFHYFNVSSSRVMLTGYLACLNEGYRLAIYDVQLVDDNGRLFYLSNWKYSDINDGKNEQLKSAFWVKSEPYVLETSAGESYPMAKTLMEMRLSQNSGIEIKLFGENKIEILEKTDEHSIEYYNLLKDYPADECEIMIAFANTLLSHAGKHVYIEH